MEYSGTTWTTKDGLRTILVEQRIPHGGEPRFLVVNLANGRKTRLGITGLLNDYRQITPEVVTL